MLPFRASRFLVLAALALVTLGLGGCSSPPDPLSNLERQFANYPEYSVLLEDADTSGTFFKTNHHRYKVITGQEDSATGEMAYSTQVTDWYPVEKDLNAKLLPLLGMVVLSKTAEGVSRTPFPPGYQYVGNSRYGNWRTDSEGREYWDYHPRYSSVWLPLYPIYRTDWSGYRTARSSNRPYYGRTPTGSSLYGRDGSVTKTTHRSFFERQQTRQAARKSGFAEKASRRVGRSSSSRSRSGFSFGGK